MERLIGVVRHYDWGDAEAIPTLVGEPADGRPWAELWFGTHPEGTATLVDGRSLADVAGPLPYLLKVLAARQPLSLQAHPDTEHARTGHREGRYPDPYPKPELLCALDDFDALCGFRPTEATGELLDELGADGLAEALRAGGPPAALGALFHGSVDAASVIDACAVSSRAEALLVTELDRTYPGEPSVAATLLLNRVHLHPGEAIYLPPGNLHAYLRGVGVELMGASDNVVRGGLTTKHVDADELLAVVDPGELIDPVLRPVEDATGCFRYDTSAMQRPTGWFVDDDAHGAAADADAPPFELWRIETAPAPGATWRPRTHELLLCTAGGDVDWPRGAAVHATPGEVVQLPSASTIFVATANPAASALIRPR